MKGITTSVIFTALMLLSCCSFAQAGGFDSTSTFQTGHSGFWYDPGAAGSGVSIAVSEEGILSVAVFTFSPTTYPEFLPGQVVGSQIVNANHLFLVGAAPTEPGLFRADIQLYAPLVGAGFMGGSGESVPMGYLNLFVVDCDTIEYRATVYSGFMPEAKESTVVFPDVSGVLKRLSYAGGTCSLDCNAVEFGPFPPNCPARER